MTSPTPSPDTSAAPSPASSAALSPFVAVDADPTIACVAQVEVLRTPWWVVRNDEVQFASGTTGRHIVFEPASGIRSGSVCLAVRGAGRDAAVAMVRAFRYPLGQWCWELPRGFVDPDDADGMVTAVRELVEETGAVGVGAVRLGMVHPDSGPLRCEVDLVAVRVEAADLVADTTEVGHARWVPVQDVWAGVADGTITCGLSMAALLRGVLAGVVPAPATR